MLNLDELKFIKEILEQSESQDSMTLDLIKKMQNEIINIENCKVSLWSFYWDCGRQGDVDGLFKATEQEVKQAIGKRVYFGEILGKHSEVYGDLEETDIKLESSEPVVVLNAIESGYNPLEYINYECVKCENTYTKDEFYDFENKICEYCHEEVES